MRPPRPLDDDTFAPFHAYGADEFLPVFEMANIPRRVHGLPMDIKLNVLQPGDRRYPHGPRVKVFRRTPEEPAAFVVRLSRNAQQIDIIEGAFGALINRSQFNQLLSFVRKYRTPLLNLWNNTGMDVDEFEAQMKAIDAGMAVGDYDPKTGGFLAG